LKDRDVLKPSYQYEIDFPENVMLTLGANPGDNILFIEEHGRIYLKKE
jgi:hypothetical protein